jgi:hypothetical protein
MKYLCLVYGEEKLMQTMDDNECAANGETIKKNGHHIAAEALQPVATATTVRVRDGKVSITDGRSPKQKNDWQVSTSSTLRTSTKQSASHPEYPPHASAASRCVRYASSR